VKPPKQKKNSKKFQKNFKKISKKFQKNKTSLIKPAGAKCVLEVIPINIG
jgi:hypothetical protein